MASSPSCIVKWISWWTDPIWSDTFVAARSGEPSSPIVKEWSLGYHACCMSWFNLFVANFLWQLEIIEIQTSWKKNAIRNIWHELSMDSFLSSDSFKLLILDKLFDIWVFSPFLFIPFFKFRSFLVVNIVTGKKFLNLLHHTFKSFQFGSNIKFPDLSHPIYKE